MNEKKKMIKMKGNKFRNGSRGNEHFPWATDKNNIQNVIMFHSIN